MVCGLCARQVLRVLHKGRSCCRPSPPCHADNWFKCFLSTPCHTKERPPEPLRAKSKAAALKPHLGSTHRLSVIAGKRESSTQQHALGVGATAYKTSTAFVPLNPSLALERHDHNCIHRYAYRTGCTPSPDHNAFDNSHAARLSNITRLVQSRSHHASLNAVGCVWQCDCRPRCTIAAAHNTGRRGMAIQRPFLPQCRCLVRRQSPGCCCGSYSRHSIRS